MKKNAKVKKSDNIKKYESLQANIFNFYTENNMLQTITGMLNEAYQAQPKYPLIFMAEYLLNLNRSNVENSNVLHAQYQALKRQNEALLRQYNESVAAYNFSEEPQAGSSHQATPSLRDVKPKPYCPSPLDDNTMVRIYQNGSALASPVRIKTRLSEEDPSPSTSTQSLLLDGQNTASIARMSIEESCEGSSGGGGGRDGSTVDDLNLSESSDDESIQASPGKKQKIEIAENFVSISNDCQSVDEDIVMETEDVPMDVEDAVAPPRTSDISQQFSELVREITDSPEPSEVFNQTTKPMPYLEPAPSFVFSEAPVYNISFDNVDAVSIDFSKNFKIDEQPPVSYSVSREIEEAVNSLGQGNQSSLFYDQIQDVEDTLRCLFGSLEDTSTGNELKEVPILDEDVEKVLGEVQLTENVPKKVPILDEEVIKELGEEQPTENLEEIESEEVFQVELKESQENTIIQAGILNEEAGKVSVEEHAPVNPEEKESEKVFQVDLKESQENLIIQAEILNDEVEKVLEEAQPTENLDNLNSNEVSQEKKDTGGNEEEGQKKSEENPIVQAEMTSQEVTENKIIAEEVEDERKSQSGKEKVEEIPKKPICETILNEDDFVPDYEEEDDDI